VKPGSGSQLRRDPWQLPHQCSDCTHGQMQGEGWGEGEGEGEGEDEGGGEIGGEGEGEGEGEGGGEGAGGSGGAFFVTMHCAIACVTTSTPEWRQLQWFNSESWGKSVSS